VKSKKFFIFLLACAGSLAALVFCLFRISHWSHLLESQQAAGRWAGESGSTMAQLSCFLPVDGEIGESAVYSFRNTLDNRLTEAALTPPENGSLYIDGYSARGSVNVSGDRGSAQAAALGIGGDYFFFHPLRLLSGSYISGNDLMHDRVVLDEELAWRLFGSNNLAGMSVTIGEKPYYVAGVVRRESDPASAKAYTDGPGIFMAYDALTEAGDAKIDCYEIALPNPISGFALDQVRGAFPLGGGTILENSARYRFAGVWSILTRYGERSMQTTGILLPYWENAARYTEDRIALLYVLCALLALLPAALAVMLAAALIRQIKKGARSLGAKVKELADYGIPRPALSGGRKLPFLPAKARSAEPLPAPAAEPESEDERESALSSKR